MNGDVGTAILMLYLGFALFVLGGLFFGFYFTGRIVTLPQDRSPIGIWFGRFAVAMGLLMVCLGALVLSRWYDLDADPGQGPMSGVMRVIGSLAITAAFVMVPMIVRELQLKVREMDP